MSWGWSILSCRHHVSRNVAALLAELSEQVQRESAPVPPPGVDSSPERLLDDLDYVQLLMALRPPDGATQLMHLLRRYRAGPGPAKGERATLCYRVRLALTRYQANWYRLTSPRLLHFLVIE